jgi:hypothetical protein
MPPLLRGSRQGIIILLILHKSTIAPPEVGGGILLALNISREGRSQMCFHVWASGHGFPSPPGLFLPSPHEAPVGAFFERLAGLPFTWMNGCPSKGNRKIGKEGA